PLRGFRTQIADRVLVGNRSDVGLEHHVELPRFAECARLAAGRTLAGIDLVRAESALAIAALYERVGESIDMAAGLPDFLIHKDSGIDPEHAVPLLDDPVP